MKKLNHRKRETVLNVLCERSDLLFAAGVQESRLCAELLISEGIHRPRLELPLVYNELIPSDQITRISDWGARVASGEPMQYVLGWTSFRGHRIRTDRRALIPRPETEELVSHVLTSVFERLNKSLYVADIGTGTGCISIALCIECTSLRLLGLDTEEDALSLAQENAKAHGLISRINLLQSDLLELVKDCSLDYVVANLPYVAEAQVSDLPRHVCEHEPISALVAGQDGLDVIRRCIPDAKRCLKPGGEIFLEIDIDQGETVEGILEETGFEGIRASLDLSGRVRIVQGNVP